MAENGRKNEDALVLAHAASRNDSQETTKAPGKPRADANVCDGVQDSAQQSSGERGIRTTDENTVKTEVVGLSGAESGAVGAPIDPLTAWLDACPVDLDDAQRDAIRSIAGR